MAYISNNSKLIEKITKHQNYEFESNMWKEKVIMDAIRITNRTNKWNGYGQVAFTQK